MKKVDIGVAEQDRMEIAKGLGRLLSDTYTLMVKTHGYHWNVTGPLFNSLHLMFETQYNELFAAADLIAERIRSLGPKAPGSFQMFREHAAVKEATGVPRAMDMVKELMEDNERVIKTIQEIFPTAEQAGDEATVDLLNQRANTHQKAAWMLRATAEE